MESNSKHGQRKTWSMIVPCFSDSYSIPVNAVMHVPWLPLHSSVSNSLLVLVINVVATNALSVLKVCHNKLCLIFVIGY